MILAVVAMVMGVMAPASATEPACADFDGSGWETHGTGHIVGQYIATSGNASIHGEHTNPAHFNSEAPPGATFCNQHGKAAPDPVTPPDTRPTDRLITPIGETPGNTRGSFHP